ncbi:Sqs1 protein [Martiniozyma asiatica (nom. inval.)]|nr:Sqs1 protein [Martiniozyma asiatica]
MPKKHKPKTKSRRNASGGSKLKGKARKAGTGIEDDIRRYGSKSLSNDYIQQQINREARDMAILERKARSHGSNKIKAKGIRKINDMIDVNNGDFSSLQEMQLQSMAFGARRPGRRMYNKESMSSEVNYTSLHRNEVLKKESRKFPIEFVKAKEVYDPSKFMLKKLIEKVGDQDLSSEEGKEELEVEKEDMDIDEIAFNDEKSDELGAEENDEAVNEKATFINTENNNFLKDNIENIESTGSSDDLSSDSHLEIDVNDIPSSDANSDDEVMIQPTIRFSELNVKDKPRQQLLFINDNNSEEFEVSFDDADDDDDDEDAAEYKEPEFLGSDSEYSNQSEREFQTGSFLGHMKKDRNGDQYIELPLNGKKHKKMFAPPDKEDVIYDFDLEDDNRTTQEVEAFVNEKLSGETKKAKMKPLSPVQPAFGYSDEDFLSFDITQIKIESMRVGADYNNVQYNIQAPMLFGFDEFQWLSKSDISEFLVENGLPENRLEPFYKYATKHLSDVYESDSEPDMIDYYDEEYELMSTSESESESEFENEQPKSADFMSLNGINKLPKGRRARKERAKEARKQQQHDAQQRAIIDSDIASSSDIDEELMEGMDDLLAMHHRSTQAESNFLSPLDVNTRTLKTKGRRRNGKDNFEIEFNINFPVDPEFRKHLTEVYLQRKENRKEKREEREKARRTDGYLLKKYPYCIEMDEAVDEFKEFHKDPSCEVMRLPPLDFNANMVLIQISEAFHYPSKKIGKGSKQYLQVRKPVSRKTREPDWQSIDRLRKKRKICFRMDAHLTKEEKRLLTRVKNGQKEEWDSSSSTKKGKANFSYKEGEVVGHNAKEISKDSIGRKLLEKMGWQNGDALGIEGNKGIIEPIKVVVKTSKRGIK